MRGRLEWKQSEWQYLGWSRVDWGNIQGKQFVVMTVRGMVLSVLERYGPLSDTQVLEHMHAQMGYTMSLKAVRNHLKTLARYGMIRAIPSAQEVGKIETSIEHVRKTPQPSHFLDTAFLTKGKVTQHARTRLGIVITAVVEVKRDSKGNLVRGRKFAYVFPGRTDTTNDLIKALDLARTHQQVKCIQTDQRPLYRSRKFQLYLLKHHIDIIQKKDFGSMPFIDGMFGQWKTNYVHPYIKKIEKMTIYDRLEYVLGTLRECFPDITIAVPSLGDMLGLRR